jgi:hypothetical protein
VEANNSQERSSHVRRGKGELLDVTYLWYRDPLEGSYARQLPASNPIYNRPIYNLYQPVAC